MDRETFRQQVELALTHLRDIVQLRRLDLGSFLLPAVPRASRGWELARYLLEAADKVRPVRADPQSWARRRYDILNLRYVNGLSPDDVADRLAVSRRHFYRQLQRALDEFSEFLWAGVTENEADKSPPAQASSETIPTDGLELLRRESAPLLQARQSASFSEVLQRAIGVLSPLLAERHIALTVDVPAALPEVSLSPGILKQFLLGLLGDLLSDERTAAIVILAEACREGLCLLVKAQEALTPNGDPDARAHGSHVDASEKASAKLAALHGARIDVLPRGSGVVVCKVTLPTVSTRAVLIVDDNEEVCLLLRRYLASGGYHPLVASSGAEAISLARSRDLYAVTLDLMMSNEDGWDVLQALTHDPKTCHLPIIVCTVLDHQELAMMLGAAAFLKKPVMREQLLQALADLKPVL